MPRQKIILKKRLGNTDLEHTRILKFVAFDLVFYALRGDGEAHCILLCPNWFIWVPMLYITLIHSISFSWSKTPFQKIIMTIICAVIPTLPALFHPKAIKKCNLKPIPCSSHFNSSHHTQESLRTSVIGDRPTQTHSFIISKKSKHDMDLQLCVNLIMLKAVDLHLQHLKLNSGTV